MGLNIFARYVWLVDTLRRHGSLTYEEISGEWQKSDLSYGETLPLRTFHSHRAAIAEIFDISIECNRASGYRYSIANPEVIRGDTLKAWLIDSYVALNQMKADRRLGHRIIFEHVPSGNERLTDIMTAMRHNHKVLVLHKRFGAGRPSESLLQPLYLRIYHRRWYLVALNEDDKVRTYGLDRVLSVVETTDEFTMPEWFDVGKYFDGATGIIVAPEVEKTKVTVRVYGAARNYVESLPLHESQTETDATDEYTTYEYDVRPTFEFYQQILSQASNIEIVSPQSVRKTMKNMLKETLNRYK